MKDDKTKKSEENKEENKDIENLEEQKEEFENKYKRALADYQNLQKRTQEEKSEWIRIANKELLLRIFPVLDTLMLANKHVNDKGLELAIGQFLDILKSEGVKRIETDGKMFEPKLMECVDVEEGEEGKVLEEIRPGYLLNDYVLRPAQVKVGSEKQN